MLALVVADPHVLTPFDEPAGDQWLVDAPLRDVMRERLERLRLRCVPVSDLDEARARARAEDEGALVILDSVACSSLVLRRFLRSAREAARSSPGPLALRCALPAGRSTDLLSKIGGLEPATGPDGEAVWTAPLLYLRGDADPDGARPVVLPLREWGAAVPLPDGQSEPVALSLSYLCRVRHWVHLLRVSHLDILSRLYERLRVGWWVGGGLWLLGRILLSFPWVGGRLHGALHWRARGARIHRLSHVGLSWVGRKAVVESGAYVDLSHVGAGAHVMQGAQVIGSVIAPGAVVSRGSVVIGSILYPKAVASQQLMQLSILGRDTNAFPMSGFFDLNMHGNVRVQVGDELVETGSRALGVCVGHHASVGPGCFVGAGREVPSRLRVTMEPAQVLSRLPDAPVEGFAVIRDGTVLPLAKRPAASPPLPHAGDDGGDGAARPTPAPAGTATPPAKRRPRGAAARARRVWLMRAPLDGPRRSPVWPDGVHVRPLQPGDERAVHALLERAYAAGGGQVAPFDEWWDGFSGDAEFDPESCIVVTAGADGTPPATSERAADEPAVVAVALCWSSGFLKDLCVDPAHRRHGLGLALVEAVKAHFRARGLPALDLKVEADNPSRAWRIYRRAGFAVVERMVLPG